MASEWHRSASGPAYAGTPVQAAAAYLRDRDAALDLSTVRLSQKSVLPLGNYQTIRYEQRYHGLPVLDTSAAVRVDAAGRIPVAVFEVVRQLAVDPQPSIDAATAKAVVAAGRGEQANATYYAWLAVQPNTGQQARLVWVVDVLTMDGGHRYQVDAHDGVQVRYRPLAVKALGRVYEVNPVQTPTVSDQTLNGLDTLTPQLLTGFSGNLFITQYVSGGGMGQPVTVEQTLQPNSGSDFLYDPPTSNHDATDAFAQVNTYYHAARAHAFYENTFGIDMSGGSWKLAAIANDREGGADYDGAYFSEQGLASPYAPNVLVIGQGTIDDFAVDSDVIMHEFTHYVSHNAIGYNSGQAGTTSYGLSTFSGSLDEALADYIACTINDEPTIGEATLAHFTPSQARDLTDTSKVCPGDVWGEVHDDGEIIGSFNWTVRTTFGNTIADQLIWGASTLLMPTASFGDYEQALLQTADDLVTQGTLTSADVTTLEGLLAARGLDDCGPEISIEAGSPLDINLFGLDMLTGFLGGTCDQIRSFGITLQSIFHFAATPNATDQAIRFAAHLSPVGGNDLNWTIYARRNEHVSFATGGMMGLPSVSEYDYASAAMTGTDGELVIDANSTPPFDANNSYHFVIVHSNCPLAMGTVSVNNGGAAGGAGGAGGAVASGGGGVGGAGTGGAATGGAAAPAASPGAEDDDSGCGCRLGPRSTPQWWLGGSLALLWLARRRRRRA